ncbi:ATP-binding cassette domain-containing protein [Micromonospora sp. 050-3]|uniref:ABC transporter ATP-binding protein n=1 Tax=Micromonospora sp. 050-3 TaxID=2789265 RepID=UPI00397D8D8B
MLAIRRAQRRFGRRVIFADLDLDVPVGARLFLGGSNGSGKTTLLRCLSGTLTLSAGQATVGGHPVGSLPARRLTGVCLAPEQGLYEKLSARENLALIARLRLPRRAVGPAVATMEQELDLTGYATLPMERCSAGMRARVSIARSLVAGPALLLLDEPGRSLDDRARLLLWEALGRRPEMTCVIASHDADDRRRCDSAVTLAVAP